MIPCGYDDDSEDGAQNNYMQQEMPEGREIACVFIAPS